MWDVGEVSHSGCGEGDAHARAPQGAVGRLHDQKSAGRDSAWHASCSRKQKRRACLQTLDSGRQNIAIYQKRATAWADERLQDWQYCNIAIESIESNFILFCLFLFCFCAGWWSIVMSSIFPSFQCRQKNILHYCRKILV